MNQATYTQMPRIAWHFLSEQWTAHGGFAVKVGETYRVEPPIIPCSRGLHASSRCIDALRYAPGPVVTLVECGGVIVDHGDPVNKFACSERRAVWGYDATEELRYFARWCALEVLHLWPNAPEIVVRYLETGDESIRAAAWAAAWGAAWAAAWDAAWDAALAAALAAARVAFIEDFEDANRVLESLIVDGAVSRGLL